MKKSEIRTHLSHCYQGENESNCKYGDKDCPAKANYVETFEISLSADELEQLIWSMENEIDENEYHGESREIRDVIIGKLKDALGDHDGH